MFTVDPNITDLKIREKNLSKVLFSMNIHQVATPDLNVEDARSCVFFFREGGKILVYIGLYFTGTGRRLYYTHSANPVPENRLSEVESEARAFAEDLGAMLDELDFSKLSPEERNRWIDDQEALWGAKKEPEPQQQPVPAAAVEKREEVSPPASTPPPAAPAAQPAPVSQPVTAVPAQPAPEQPAPAPQPRPEPEPAEQPSLAATAPPAAAQPRAKQAPPQPSPAARKVAPAQSDDVRLEVPEPDVPAVRPDQVLQDAVKAGVVKTPKAQLKKEIRTAAGVVSRDKEALARLLASF